MPDDPAGIPSSVPASVFPALKAVGAQRRSQILLILPKILLRRDYSLTAFSLSAFSLSAFYSTSTHMLPEWLPNSGAYMHPISAMPLW